MNISRATKKTCLQPIEIESHVKVDLERPIESSSLLTLRKELIFTLGAYVLVQLHPTSYFGKCLCVSVCVAFERITRI